WNITRFVISKLGDWGPTKDQRPKTKDQHGSASLVFGPSSLVDATLADRWILSRYNSLVGEVDRLMRAYNFGEAGRQIQEFLWSEFADWYVEIAKTQLEGPSTGSGQAGAQRQQLTREVLYTVLEGSLRLLHPFMPFVTEEAWQYLTKDQRKTKDEANIEASDPWSLVLGPWSIMVAPYPMANEAALDEAAERDFALVRELIGGIRNVRNEYKVEPARWVAATIASGPRAAMLNEQRALLVRLARVADDRLVIAEQLGSKPAQAATLVVGDVEVFLPLAGLIDLEAERARLSKELE